MRFPRPDILNIVFVLLLGAVLLAACGSTSTTPTSTPAVPPTSPASPVPTPQPAETFTPDVPNTLVICTQDEPQTLYLYGGSSRSMWSVLEAVYDGPFDTRGFSAQPVILEKIPALADGDALIRPVSVRGGDPVVDVDGNLVALEAGTRVLPSGCAQPECAVTWDGASELSLDQLVVTFKLLPGILWSDGSPLTAADSTFSYAIASDPATPSSKYLTDRTFSYKALDELAVEWTGMPGYFEPRYGTFFWTPLPKHLLGEMGAANLLVDPTVAQSPMGWGPYVIQEWVAGDHITMKKNASYFRAAEGLPRFDTLVVRFIGSTADGNMNALLAGECDVVDQNTGLLEMLPGLLERENNGRLKTYAGQGPEWEHLDFGIRPASYDDGYDPSAGDRPDLFGDPRTRQAFAYCIDREKIVNELLFRRSAVPTTFLPPSHPLAAANLPGYAYSVEQGANLLDEVGWKDSDGDPATPRVASGVAGVPDGTPLAVAYSTTEAALRRQVSQAVAQSLAGCGIQASLQLANPGVLFGPGPEGLVFGRQFDLVQFSWEASARPNCLLYTTAQIPTAGNRWIGSNVTGYTSPAFDAACSSAYWTRAAGTEEAAAQQKVQELFAAEIPVIPLYFYPKIAISRSDLCGLEMDVSARSIFWNVEQLTYGSGCN